MHKKKFVTKIAFSIFVAFINIIFCNEKKEIKIFVYYCKNDILTKIEFFSQRLFNKQYCFLLLTLFERERFSKNNFINKLINNNFKIVKNKLFFLF